MATLLTGILPAAANASATLVQAPLPFWQGVSQLRVTCVVSTERGNDTGALHHQLCGRLRAAVGAGAPVPVVAGAIGDPQMLAAGTMTLVMQARVAPSSAGPVLAFTIRPWRNLAEPGPMIGASPRVVPFARQDSAQWSKIDTALHAALSETLPWRTSPAGARQRVQ